jgi:hypothetical protein
MNPTIVYDDYWRFAAERHAMYLRRLEGKRGPWTDDPILRTYRFTNAYRASDRVSQFLIRRVQYAADRSRSPQELFFRTLLFKLFNKVETWEYLENQLGPVSWQSFDFDAADRVLNDAIARGSRIYSAAYIMPSPALGGERKHTNHLRLLKMMMEDGLPAKVEKAGSLSGIFDLLIPYPGLGKFLAFQYCIDLNYAPFLSLEETEFVVAGPGALDGIAKCFDDADDYAPEDIIHAMVDRQEAEFKRLGLDFPGLFGRRLQPIDCQNLFCEISKYARVAHPDVPGISGRMRIKQTYKLSSRPLQQPFYPTRWNLAVPAYTPNAASSIQPGLFDAVAA